MSWWRPHETESGPVVAPSVLSADMARLAQEIAAVEAAGAGIIHFDVMDGHFVPNLSFGPQVARAVRSVTDLPIDCHLMLTDPGRYALDFVAAGATSITFHWELPLDHRGLLRRIRGAGARGGLVLRPSTPLPPAMRALLPECDLILIMSVEPGFSGQSFEPAALPKIEELVRWRQADGLDFPIEIDGGINPQTAAAAREAGADILVSGSTLFGARDYARMVRKLRGSEEAISG